jgi:hypothetical protein
MTESTAPRGSDWNEIVEVLHTLTNTMTTRAHYPEGHPAIVRADEIATGAFIRLLERFPELVVALIDGEFVVSERPFPELRTRLRILAEAMVRHDIECLVFQRGLALGECTTLGRSLSMPADVPGRVRSAAQRELSHVLLRFVELKKGEARTGVATSAFHFVPVVAELLGKTAGVLVSGGSVDRDGVHAVAKEILQTCSLRSFVLTERAWTRTLTEAATHATNVAMIVGAMAIEGELPDALAVELTAAALLHDIGQLLLPDEIRGLPEPLVGEKNLLLFRNHSFAGASALLAAGAPPLWIAAALEHHRGVDGGGYPALDSKAPPQELVRMIALANFFDRKRTLLEGRSQTPEDVIGEARVLEERYFGRPLVDHFVRSVGLYPPGTTVELSNRQPALVVSSNPTDPFRPRVLVLRGPDRNKRVDLKEIDPARSRHNLSIVRAVPPPLFVLADGAPETDRAEAGRTAVPAPAVGPPMHDVLEGLVLEPTRVPLVTSPPAPPTTATGPPGRPSRPVVMQEIVTLRPGGYSTAPRTTPSMPAPPKISIPPLTAPRIDPRAEPAPTRQTAEIPLSSILRRTGAIPTGLDHRGAFLLTFVDGASSAEDVLDASGLPKAEFMRIVGELLESGTLLLG